MNEHLQLFVKKPVLFTVSVLLLVFFAFSSCNFTLHDEVYPLANAKSRTIATATISPGGGTEYAFTIDKQPSIEISSPVSGAAAYYSIDGGAYERYTGAFTLPIADPKVDQAFTVNAYITHPEYKDSTPVSQTYRFVATTVPTPTIQATPEASFFHFYYHYDNAPQIDSTCSLAQATIWYSLDEGVTYAKYSGAFTLPLPSDQSAIKTLSIQMYATLSGYLDSAISTASFRFAPNGTIVTIAGIGGMAGFKDGEAESALFNWPYGLYVDAAKNVYVADQVNSRVRRIAPDGSVSTVAGNGVDGYSGDGGLATEASLKWPLSITMDETNGILYIADTSNGCVRAVSLGSGSIVTYAGNPCSGALYSPESKSLLAGSFRAVSGIAYHPTYGMAINDPGFYATFNISGPTITRIAGTAGSSGISSVGDDAVTCLFQNPRALAWGSDGTLYISDDSIGNGHLYSVSGGKIASVYSGLLAPFQIHPVGSGVYIAESGSNEITRVTGSMKIVIAGTGSSGFSGDGGLATAAQLHAPSGVFVVPGDGVYLSDTENYCIRKIILY